MTKILEYSDSARKSLINGVEMLAKTVRVTLGPRGRYVMIGQKFDAPLVTNDGVTVAKEVDLKDPYENLAAQLVKKVAEKTNDIAGDGTTTSIVIACEMMIEGIRYVTAGGNPIVMQRIIKDVVKECCNILDKMSKPLVTKEAISQVGFVASRDEQIGDIISEAMSKVGKDGVITVEESNTTGNELVTTDGMQFDQGYLSPNMVTDQERAEAILDKPYILVHQEKISTITELVPLLDKITTEKRPLLIIAEDIEGEALSTLVLNKVRGLLNVVAVKAPGFGDRRKAMLEDIAISTGARFVSPELGIKLNQVGLHDLGTARRVTITKDKTTILDGAGKTSKVSERITQIKHEIETTDSDWDKEKLHERLAKLAGGVCVIRIGAATDVELKEKKHRMEDAISAVKAAVSEGIIPGSASTLVHISSMLDDNYLRNNLKLVSDDEFMSGVIVRKAILSPLYWIAENAAAEGDVVVEHVKGLDKSLGYNALTREYVDLVEAGVIDPVKVVKSALENAASVVGLLLTTETLVAEKPVKKSDAPAPGGMPGGMGGMPGAMGGMPGGMGGMEGMM